MKITEDGKTCKLYKIKLCLKYVSFKEEKSLSVTMAIRDTELNP